MRERERKGRKQNKVRGKSKKKKNENLVTSKKPLECNYGNTFNSTQTPNDPFFFQFLFPMLVGMDLSYLFPVQLRSSTAKNRMVNVFTIYPSIIIIYIFIYIYMCHQFHHFLKIVVVI